MSDSTRGRVNAAFDDELAATPVPPGLRALSVHAAVSPPRPRSGQPALLALVAAVVMVALVAALVVGSHALRSTPMPVRPNPSATPPAARAEANLVYDQARGELVLFGGSSSQGGVVNETWTWDGKAWRLYKPTSSPSPRHQAVMTYDQAHREVVLFGGMAQVATSGKAGQTAVDDTWTWDGSTWKEKHPSNVPAFGYDWPATMAYDPLSKTVLLYGFKKTTSESLTNMTAETWSWNGSDWTRLPPTSGPTAPSVLVAAGAQLYLMSLSPVRVGGRYVTQMWRWDGRTWTLLDTNNALREPVASVSFDAQRGTLVGYNNGDTWTWDGSTWVRQHPQTQPPATGYLAYFQPLHEVVSWGNLYGASSNEMWAWDGTTWTQLQAGTGGPLPTPPAGQLGPVTPAAAAAFVRQTVTTSRVLLPTSLPPGLEARAFAATDSFTIDYATDQRDKRITLGMIAANPPPGDEHSTDTQVTFRGHTARYFVYDGTAPLSDRWLMWTEGGEPKSGTEYFLSADGLTDAEFWHVANSLR